MNKLNGLGLGSDWLKYFLVLALLGIVTGCTMPLIHPPNAPAPSAAEEAVSDVAPTAAANEATASTPSDAPQETYKDVPVGFTVEGYPYRGSPDAPVTMYEYSDYQCPFCSRYFVQTEPALNESFVRSGQVRVIFRDYPIAQIHPNAPAAHVAAWCVAEQGSAAAYWEMHDELFRTQTVWSNMTDPASHFAELAEEIGVELSRFNDCIASGAMGAKLEQGLAAGSALGISGTPSFSFVGPTDEEGYLLVGAQPYDQFANMIEAVAAGDPPPQAQQQQPAEGDPQIPFWATAEGLTPDPARPGYTTAGDEYRGNPEAKVVVIEFSDFQCPYCRRHVEETQALLDETFVDTDQVLWVFKHFPLNFHPQAEAASVAAECAADQGKFWEMHELLFTSVEQWSISDPTPIFDGLASELTLDADTFSACLTDGDALQRVQSDMQDGAALVEGTPTFVVLFNGEGRLIPGALPAERFKEALQQAVDQTAQ